MDYYDSKTAKHAQALPLLGLIGLLLALSMLTSCAVLSDRKAAIAYAYAGTAADFASTKIKLDEGCRETNPLMPNDKAIAIGALVSLGAVRLLDMQNAPLWTFWLLGTLHGGAAAYNMKVNCK